MDAGLSIVLLVLSTILGVCSVIGTGIAAWGLRTLLQIRDDTRELLHWRELVDAWRVTVDGSLDGGHRRMARHSDKLRKGGGDCPTDKIPVPPEFKP